MQLLEHRPSSILLVKAVQNDGIWLGEKFHTSSFVLSPTKIILTLDGISSVDAVEIHRIDELIALNPDVIILGTGTKQKFPSAMIRAHVMKNNIGLEAMDNGAAARTFNVLASEGRNVIALFFI